MTVLGRFAEFTCGIFGVTPERLNEVKTKTSARRRRSLVQNSTESTLKTRMTYGWPTG